MKISHIHYFACIILFAFSPNGRLFAQELSACKIAYSYDAAGNRIKRAFYCDNPPDPRGETGQPDGGVTTTLNPNPTQGPVTGYFSEPVSSGTVDVSSMSGTHLMTIGIDKPTRTFSLNLSALSPGSYIVTVRLRNQVSSFTVIKM
jgi:hypothetical protein